MQQRRRVTDRVGGVLMKEGRRGVGVVVGQGTVRGRVASERERSVLTFSFPGGVEWVGCSFFFPFTLVVKRDTSSRCDGVALKVVIVVHVGSFLAT